MPAPSTTLERAFALARSGACANVQDIRLALKREHFDQVDAHLASPALARQLRALCDAAGAAPVEADPIPSRPVPAQPH